MKVKGINKAYDVEVRKVGREGVAITVGNFVVGMISVVIDKEDWKEIIKEVSGD